MKIKQILYINLIFICFNISALHAGEICTASHYGKGDGLNGSRTANGERFNTHAFTAAHRTRPFGSRVRVTHHGRSVVVRISDRGPFVHGRCIDLSWAAAKAIGIDGIGRVTVETAQ